MPPRYSTFKTFLFSSSFILVRDVIFVFVNDEANVSDTYTKICIMLSSFAPKSSRSVLFCYRKLKCKDQRVTALVSEIKLIFKTALRFIRSFGHACTRHLPHYFQLGAIIDYGSCFSGKKLRMEISIDADVLGCFQHKYVYIAARSINYLFHVNF